MLRPSDFFTTLVTPTVAAELACADLLSLAQEDKNIGIATINAAVMMRFLEWRVNLQERGKFSVREGAAVISDFLSGIRFPMTSMLYPWPFALAVNAGEIDFHGRDSRFNRERRYKNVWPPRNHSRCKNARNRLALGCSPNCCKKKDSKKEEDGCRDSFQKRGMGSEGLKEQSADRRQALEKPRQWKRARPSLLHFSEDAADRDRRRNGYAP
jgi:hypothetical protein